MNAFYGCSAPVVAASTPGWHRRSLAWPRDHAPHAELIEAQGHVVIYGDTDSTFVWLGRAHSDEAAERIGRDRYSGSTNGGASA